jgi:hypothetical protein
VLMGAFEKLRKANMSYVISVCLSVCPAMDNMENFGSHWMDFHGVWHLIIFRKFVRKLQVSLNRDKNNRYFTWTLIYVHYDNILHSSS